MQKLSTLLVALALLMYASCTPSEEPNDQPVTYDFSCVQLFDSNGEPLGYDGCNSSSDWTQLPLSAQEAELLNFSDTVSLTGTAAAGVSQLAAFPIPAVRNDVLYFSLRGETADQAVKLKLAIVDESLQVLARYALRTATNGAFALQMDGEDFQNGQHYRIYYRASTADNPALFEGYGNILVCKTYIAPGGGVLSDCL
jgi:hypothetical protein